jgi:hypothetical protein
MAQRLQQGHFSDGGGWQALDFPTQFDLLEGEFGLFGAIIDGRDRPKSAFA